MPLKRAGYFRELQHGTTDGPSLREALANSPWHCQDKVVEYLRSASCLAVAAGPFYDELAPDRPIAGPLAIYTDGVWSWPSDLPYYVEKYNARVPGEFLEHMESRSWEAVKLTDEELIELSENEFDAK